MALAIVSPREVFLHVLFGESATTESQCCLNKYSAALCASANSAFNFDVNHLNAESAETQRAAERKKGHAVCANPDRLLCSLTGESSWGTQ